MHGTTFGGGPLACAVAIEFLRILDGMLAHIRKLGDYFQAELSDFEGKVSQYPRGSGDGSNAWSGTRFRRCR